MTFNSKSSFYHFCVVRIYYNFVILIDKETYKDKYFTNEEIVHETN